MSHDAHDKCAAVRLLLADGFWHDARALRAVGGDRYGARVDEIRNGTDGRPPMFVECTVEANVSSWRMRPYKPGEREALQKQKRARKSKRELELEERVAQLEFELQRLKAQRTAAAVPQMGLFEVAR